MSGAQARRGSPPDERERPPAGEREPRPGAPGAAPVGLIFLVRLSLDFKARHAGSTGRPARERGGGLLWGVARRSQQGNIAVTVLLPVATASSLWWWDVVVVLDRRRICLIYLGVHDPPTYVADSRCLMFEVWNCALQF